MIPVRTFVSLPQGIDTLPQGCSLLTRQAETNYGIDLIRETTLGCKTLSLVLKYWQEWSGKAIEEISFFFHLKHFTFL